VSNWRQEERERARDDADRVAYRERSRMTHADRLAEVDAMVADGSLTVRLATPGERLRFGIRPAIEEVAVLEAETSPSTEQHLGGMDELAAIRTPSQRAAALIQRVDWGSEPVLTAAELAEEAGVATRTVERCLRVKEADPALFQELVAGKISATTADDQISARMEGKGG
jgi:hypothetical protein